METLNRLLHVLRRAWDHTNGCLQRRPGSYRFGSETKL
jgi:hypothetical protein